MNYKRFLFVLFVVTIGCYPDDREARPRWLHTREKETEKKLCNEESWGIILKFIYASQHIDQIYIYSS